MIKNCLVCNGKFKTKPFQIKKGNGKFCSKKCFKKFRKNNPSYMMENVSSYSQKEKICPICNKIFMVKKSHYNRLKHCSKKCMSIAYQLKLKGEMNPNWKGGKIKKTCLNCSKQYFVLKAVSKNSKYCSQECHFAFKNKNSTLHINIRIRTSEKYRKWRKEVFIRDDFACQNCGQKGGRIQAHHKRRLSRMIDFLKSKTLLVDLYKLATIYKPLWNIANGITLCEKCHKKRHKKL